MLDQIISLLTPQIVVTLLAAIAAFATTLTLLMPVLSRDRLIDAHAGDGHRARQDARRAPGRSRQEGRPGPAAVGAQGLHAGDRRQAQPAQRVRDRGGARQAEDGGLARAGAARRLHVLPRRHAGDHRRHRAALSVRDRRLRLSGPGQDRPGHRRRLRRLLSAQHVRREPGAAPPDLDQERLPGRARHAAHLRAVGHVDRGRVPEGVGRGRRRSRWSSPRSSRSPPPSSPTCRTAARPSRTSASAPASPASRRSPPR